VQHPRSGRAVSYRRLIRWSYKLEKHLLEDELRAPSPGGKCSYLSDDDDGRQEGNQGPQIGRKYLNHIQN